MATQAFNASAASGGWARIAIPVIVIAAAAWLIWTFAGYDAGVRREVPSISTIVPVDMPPPPPPPKEPPPPTPRPVEQTLPEPTPLKPQPVQQQPSPQAPAQPTAGQNAVTQNAPAQAGSDAFNIGSGDGRGGRGSGTAGGGFVETAGMYGAYVKARIAQAVRGSAALRGKSFSSSVRVWFDASGTITRVEIARTTGISADDAELRRVLSGLGGFRAPPASALAQMPIHFSIDGRPQP